VRIGYHASHEQFAPSELLACVKLAQRAGFAAAKSSDHFHPWGEEQGQSGFAWSWLGAALEATSFPIGVISAPGWRYHPAILAQAAATLAEMYPGRFWLALGSGQALNEAITGMAWPPKPERNARLLECAEVIRALLNGERVTRRGQVHTVEAQLYTRPATPPPLYGAAVTPETAELVGGWSDGLLTVGADPKRVRGVADAFRRGGGGGKRLLVQVAVSWAESEAEALEQAHAQWRYNVLGGDVNWTLRTPAEFDTATRLVRPEDMRASVLVSADLERHAAWIAEYREIGCDEIYLHNVGTNQRAFIEAFGERVLPQALAA